MDVITDVKEFRFDIYNSRRKLTSWRSFLQEL